MYLLQRRPEEWRNLQSERKRSQEQHVAAPKESAPVVETPAQPSTSDKNRKRKSRPEDEIDALFNAKLGKRVKKAALSETADDNSKILLAKDLTAREGDKELEQVLGAIRLAPKNDGQLKKKQKRT